MICRNTVPANFGWEQNIFRETEALTTRSEMPWGILPRGSIIRGATSIIMSTGLTITPRQEGLLLF